MNTIDEIRNSEISNEPNQKWAEPFADLLDEIYFSGYAISLAEEDPATYNREYFYFLSVYE